MPHRTTESTRPRVDSTARSLRIHHPGHPSWVAVDIPKQKVSLAIPYTNHATAAS